MEKICKTCKVKKPITEFYKDKSFKDGYRANCKPCKDVSTYAWREKHKDKYNENMRKLRASDKNMFKNIDLKRTYGITLEDYTKMLVEQGHTCKICKKPNPSTKRTFAVDHDHLTGKIRGLLCYGCNRAMHVLDTQDLLNAAIAYKNSHKECGFCFAQLDQNGKCCMSCPQSNKS
jgi:hypothetical protein